MTRRFEFVAGTSAKFWEVDHHGNQVTVRYGRIGTEGQTQTKSFDTAGAAGRHAQQQIERKLRKGYAECAAV